MIFYPINKMSETNNSPEANLMKAVVIQSLKDYYKTKDKSIIEWIEKKNGSFSVCATAMGLPEDILKEMMLKKIKSIKNGNKLFNTTSVLRTSRRK